MTTIEARKDTPTTRDRALKYAIDPDRVKLYARPDAGCVYDAAGELVAASCGHFLIVYGARTLETAIERLAEGVSRPAEDPFSVTVRSSAGRIFAGLSPTSPAAPVTVTLRTKRDAAIYEAARTKYLATLATLRAELTACDPRARVKIGGLKASISAYEGFIRDLEAGRTAFAHAVLVGSSTVDLRLVRRILRATGAKRATLTETSPCEPGPLIVALDVDAFAVVMPFAT